MSGSQKYLILLDVFMTKCGASGAQSLHAGVHIVDKSLQTSPTHIGRRLLRTLDCQAALVRLQVQLLQLTDVVIGRSHRIIEDTQKLTL